MTVATNVNSTVECSRRILAACPSKPCRWIRNGRHSRETSRHRGQGTATPRRPSQLSSLSGLTFQPIRSSSSTMSWGSGFRCSGAMYLSSGTTERWVEHGAWVPSRGTGGRMALRFCLQTDVVNTQHHAPVLRESIHDHSLRVGQRNRAYPRAPSVTRRSRTSSSARATARR